MLRDAAITILSPDGKEMDYLQSVTGGRKLSLCRIPDFPTERENLQHWSVPGSWFEELNNKE